MRVAYLVLAHSNPLLLKRLLGVLSSEDSGFFIHIDRKVDIRTFSDISGDSIFFSAQRIPVYWGEFSQVEATMLLIRQALTYCPHYDYLVFLQGSDLPLRSGRYIRCFLEKNRGQEFLSMVKMPAPGYPLSKINKLRYPSDKPIRRFVTRTLAKLALSQRDYRKYLEGLEAYSGQACWTLSRQACQYIVEFAESNPHVEEFFRNTFTSDEMFFHTILGNSLFRPLIRRNLVYVDWSNHSNHPSMLNDEHVRMFEAQETVRVEDEWGSGEVLFARKFSDRRLDLVERIDEMIRRKEGQGATSILSADRPYKLL